ncbi:Putative Oxidoreductase-like protein [[Torrubiella] hemipterigena]|uniref:Putative Oxidoreductase-like protein n=1 Tax=[Torrubiella] hemipterigena TaxID=1531966 RepID=A0A0A1SN66_9HYPO|nr:Putative Oxidoreductase-like protein [[Torrubiella] hemipterigena]
MADYDVLVTGAAGHLGAALMLALPGLGFKPFGVDILESETTTLVGSISDREFVTKVLATSSHFKHIINAATLHKPHVDSHTKLQFIDTNISGTIVLLEEAARLGDQIQSFLFLSTTSTFGTALSPKPGNPAAWITEDVVPQPKNIYGVTKVAAEDMCFLVHKQTGLPVLVLRASRFFPEDDDDDQRRGAMGGDNLKVLELAYRRCDIEDIVSACVCGMNKAKQIGWGKYIISAPPPFVNNADTLSRLDSDAASVMKDVIPDIDTVFNKLGWKYLDRLDRVYDSSKAVRELDWKPKYTLAHVVQRLAAGQDWKSELTDKVGVKGYHATSTGVYTKR